MKKAFPRFRALSAVLSCALLYAGCAAVVLPGALETASTALTLGSLGQTLVNATYLGDNGAKVAVAPLPANYRGNAERMLREAWEQNYQYVKCARWEDEDIPWKDLARTALRKGRGEKAVLVLVEQMPNRRIAHAEERTFYATASGKLVRDPAEAAGESYYPHTRTQQQSITLYAYSAFFFTRSKQPSGLLLGAAQTSGACPPGVLIRAVGRKTAGEKAGLRGGDIITHVNGRNADPQTLFSLFAPGGNAVGICRDGANAAYQLEIPSPLRKRSEKK